MRQQFRISSLDIEGFRGINKKIKINLNGSSAVLFGPNGVGKSSIMQAIEWCLFGELILAVAGPVEFKKEDAIVNSFHSQKRAAVEIILQGERDKRVKVSRERKLAKSTTAGKTELKIEIEGTEYSGEEAQFELNKLLGVTSTGFYASTYLHQEAIRDLIVGDPLLRSEVIDKLLGLHFVRELIDYLPLKYVAKEAKTIEEEIEEIKQRKMQEVVISRKRLGELQVEMKESGIEESELEPAALIKRIEETSRTIDEMAQKIRTKIRELEKPTYDLESFGRTLDYLKESIEGLERVWHSNYKNAVNKASNLKATRKDYEEAMKEVASLETPDPKDLLQRKSEISDRISRREKELNNRLSARQFLQDESVLGHRLHSNSDELKSKLEEIKKEFGEEASIEENVKKLQSQIDDKLKIIREQEALGSLLVSALQYLKSALPKECPVCKSDIAYQNVISILEEEIGERESAKVVRRLQKELEELKRSKTQTEDALNDLRRFQSDLERILSEIEEEKLKLKRNGFEPSGDLVEYVDGELGKISSEIYNIDEEIRGLKSEATQMNLKLDDLQRRIQKLSSIQKQAQEIIRVTETGEKLLTLLDEQISGLDEDTRILERVTEDIRVSKNNFEICEKIFGFLKERNRVDKLEKGLPLLQRRLKDLKEKYSKIKELEIGMTDIYQAVSTAREEMVKRALSELQSTVGSYYSKVLCHPYYVNLQLIPEEERGKAIYRIRAWDKGFKQGTYVATRFSNAQMNAVALSLFLSMSMRLQSNVGLIMLDDPSQSMDKFHKEALSKLLDEVSKEKQILVATQDMEFKQCLEKSLNKAKTMTCEIREWDTTGPRISL